MANTKWYVNDSGGILRFFRRGQEEPVAIYSKSQKAECEQFMKEDGVKLNDKDHKAFENFFAAELHMAEVLFDSPSDGVPLHGSCLWTAKPKKAI